jgi:Protein of unknown function DUF262
MNLEKKIETLRADVQSDRMSMSIGELAGLYERKELDIHPKFQRILRWSDEQKTKLIESILLRIPIPPIFVAQDKNGNWDVVDGVQRLGTIFEFLGVLKNADGELLSPLKLARTILLPELDGVLFDSQDSSSKVFTPSQRLDFRRSRLDLHVILKESTPSSKYELFERLNTGGSTLSPQEVRNCVLVWMNESLFDWMLELSRDGHFQNTTPISERLVEEQFGMELVLRFFVLYSIQVEELRGFDDLSEFLNERNRGLAENTTINRKEYENVFRNTFALLDEALSGDCFRKYETARDRFLGAFLISSFEAVALGVAYNINEWTNKNTPAQRIAEKVKLLWNVREFTENIGIGKSARTRMGHTIPLGRRHFVP